MNLLERMMGPPMAAPETPALRRLRIIFIMLVSASGLSVLTLDRWVALLGRASAGGALLALMVTTAVFGAVFFIRKSRTDDHWLLARGFDCDGEDA